VTWIKDEYSFRQWCADRPAYANVLLQIYNSSLHRYVKLGPVLALETFNAIPHLEAPERATARTWL
jgi:hypothetical protein